MLTAYLILAAWFWLTDMAAAWVADVPMRPIAGALLAVVWPLSMSLALIASAAIISRLRTPNTTGGGDG